MKRKIIHIKEELCNGCGDCIRSCAEGALKIIDGKAKLVREDFCDGFGACLGHCPTGALVIEEREAAPFDEKLAHGALEQWPVQLHLVNPKAPFFKNKELVVLSTCSPIAGPSVHADYIRGRSVVVACPKLDNTAPYVEKMASILKETTIPKVIVLIMEVPCCNGLAFMATQGAKLSGREDLSVEIHTLTLDGELKGIRKL